MPRQGLSVAGMTTAVWPEAMFTAHRKLPRGVDRWLDSVLPQRIAKLHDEYGTERFTTGMAVGGDMRCGGHVQRLGLPLRAAVPYPSQPLDGRDGRPGQRWSKAQQQCWQELCAYARSTGGLEHVRDSDPRSPGERVGMLHGRNDWMLQRSTVVLALWQPVKDGKINDVGGTYSCIVKAIGRGMPVILFDLNALTVTLPTP